MALNRACVVATQHGWMTIPLTVFGCDRVITYTGWKEIYVMISFANDGAIALRFTFLFIV